mmetsp:Transcript_8494/g.23972  ORF Transcript_8494/g.23972 Transcript_8494/m.23972 type:complete len:221 (-) Transcript_8494:372-1034(-)
MILVLSLPTILFAVWAAWPVIRGSMSSARSGLVTDSDLNESLPVSLSWSWAGCWLIDSGWAIDISFLPFHSLMSRLGREETAPPPNPPVVCRSQAASSPGAALTSIPWRLSKFCRPAFWGHVDSAAWPWPRKFPCMLCLSCSAPVAPPSLSIWVSTAHSRPEPSAASAASFWARARICGIRASISFAISTICSSWTSCGSVSPANQRSSGLSWRTRCITH